MRKIALLPVILGAIIVAGVSGVSGYFIYEKLHEEKDSSIEELSRNDNGDARSETDPDDTSDTGITLYSGEIAWQNLEEIESLHIFEENGGASREDTAKYYRVGTFVNGLYEGSWLVLVSSNPMGPAFYPDFFHIVQREDELVLFAQHSPELYSGDGVNQDVFSIDETYAISDLVYSEILQGPSERQTLQRVHYVNVLFDDTNLSKVFTHEAYGDVYTTAAAPADPEFAGDPFDKYGFYIKAPDSTTIVYELVVDFVDELNVPQITLNDGSVNNGDYSYTDLSGCGSLNYISVVFASDVDMDDLGAIGTNSYGDTIYGFTDSEHAFLLDQYENKYMAREKMPYDEFLANHPIFFWIDPFDRLIKFESSLFVPAVECGKPVIYLYPKEQTRVFVTLEPRGGFSYTEPVYRNGWEVFADPSGRLTEVHTGETYPYLFWEGRGGVYKAPEKGFVVLQSEIHSFLVKKLSKLGLNKRESADFIEFWEPKMQDAPYYFVSFYGNRVMDELAPLAIFPKPDSVIRILMDFRPLTAPIRVEEYEIRTPKRTGFTVVEWGGVIR